jgi:hypothetical protein
MRRLLLSIALAVGVSTASIGLGTASALAEDSGAQKVPFVHDADVANCGTGLPLGTLGTGNGFAVIHEHGGNLATEVALKHALPNTTYAVFLVQTPSGADCLARDTSLTTNGRGNGNVHWSEPMMPGTTGAWVGLVFPEIFIATDFFTTEGVTFG